MHFILVPAVPKKIPNKHQKGQPIDNTTMVIKVAGHEYCVTNKPKRHSKSHSLGSISDFRIEIEKTKIDRTFYSGENNNSDAVECKNVVNNQSVCYRDVNNSECDDSNIPEESQASKIVISNTQNVAKAAQKKVTKTHQKPIVRNTLTTNSTKNENYALSKSKSDGNPFQHKRKGRIIKVDRPNLRGKKSQYPK